MNRIDLVEKLERVAPALSANNLVPVLSHFWFKGDTLMCYNDQIAVSTKLKTDFRGAVPATLTSLLSVSRAKEIEFVDGEKEILLVKAASSKFKLPFLLVEQTKIFEMPKADLERALPVDIGAFIAAVDSCMRSLKEDTSVPDSLGITLELEAREIRLYATNDATISTAVVALKAVMPIKRVVISGNFCRQMLALAKLDGKKHIEIHDDYSLFQCGDDLLFGRLVDIPRPLDFVSVIEQSYPAELESSLVSIPTKLQLILERAVIITESKTERSLTKITVKDGIAKFFSKSEKGEVRDSVQLEDTQLDVEVGIDPRLFKMGYGFFDKMLLTEACLIMTKGDSLYLVSASA